MGEEGESVWEVTNTQVNKIMCCSILEFLTSEDGTGWVSRNVGTEAA